MATASASGDVELVRDFVNTVNLEDGVDELASPADLKRWLVGAGLLGRRDSLSAGDLERAVAVREALRALIGVNSGGTLDPVSHALLQDAADRARLAVRFRRDGTSAAEPAATGLDGALGRILAAAHYAMDRGTWPRLRLCGRDSCRWAFYDASRNGSKRWCSMEVCGNREKAEAFQLRRKEHTHPR